MPGTASKDTTSEREVNLVCREILNYLARHPFTKFNRMALVGMFKPEDSRRVDQALKKLMSQELVAYQSNGSLYWLTPEEPAHSLLRAQFGGRTQVSSIPGALFSGDLAEATFI